MNTANKIIALLSLTVAATLMSGSVSLAAWSAPRSVSLGCRLSDGVAYNLRNTIASAMSRTDTTSNIVIASYGIVRVSSTQVVAVSDTTTCRRAAEAYNAAINSTDPDRQVHTIRAGIRYVVIDPTYGASSGYLTGVTVDSAFAQVYKKFSY